MVADVDRFLFQSFCADSESIQHRHSGSGRNSNAASLQFLFIKNRTRHQILQKGFAGYASFRSKKQTCFLKSYSSKKDCKCRWEMGWKNVQCSLFEYFRSESGI